MMVLYIEKVTASGSPSVSSNKLQVQMCCRVSGQLHEIGIVYAA